MVVTGYALNAAHKAQQANPPTRIASADTGQPLGTGNDPEEAPPKQPVPDDGTAEHEQMSTRAYQGSEPYTYTLPWEIKDYQIDAPGETVLRFIWLAHQQMEESASSLITDDFVIPDLAGYDQKAVVLNIWEEVTDYNRRQFTPLEVAVNSEGARCVTTESLNPGQKTYVFRLRPEDGWKIYKYYEDM